MQRSHSRRAYERMKESRFHSDMQPQAPTVRRRTRRRGIALVWVALTLIIMVGIVGLSLDFARGALVAHQLHNGADAGALAGAMVVKLSWPQAMSDAIAIAHRNNADQLPIAVTPNPSNDPAGEVVVGRWIRQLHQFFPTTVSPNAVKVWGDRSGSGGDMPAISLLFGPIFGTQTVDIKRHAIAYCTGMTGAGIILLSEHPEIDYAPDKYPASEYGPVPAPWTYKETTFVVGGNTYIDLRGVDYKDGTAITGDIQVDGASMGGPPIKDAFVFNGSSADLYIGDFKVTGSTNPAWDSDKWASLQPPAPEPPFSVLSGPALAPYVADPLKDVPPPDISSMIVPYTNRITDQTVFTDGYSPEGQPDLKVLQLNPGYYPGGIELGGAYTGLTPGPDGVLGTVDDVTQTFQTEIRFNMGGSVETSVFALGGDTNGTSGLILKGGANMVGRGVMLYITGAQTAGGTTYDVKYGSLSITGSGYIELSPPGDFFLVDGKPQVNGLPGISMWQDRNNHNPAKLAGTANYNLSGTLYMGYNPVTVSGNIAKGGSQLLAGALDLSGGLSLGIAYDGRNRDDALGSCLVE